MLTRQAEKSHIVSSIELMTQNTEKTAVSASQTALSAEGALTSSMSEGYSSQFNSQRANKIAANAAVHNGVLAAAVDYEGVRQLRRTFSIELKQGSITNQKRSGRCWMFSGLNVCRYEMIKDLNLADLELSETYLFFWDKMEKANYYLESILDTLDEPLTSREWEYVNADLVDDGGWFWGFANLVNKYGLMPADAYPESANSDSSADMVQYVNALLREDAAQLRARHEQGASLAVLREVKSQMLAAIYRMLSISLGEPPATFDFVVRTKDDEDKDSQSAESSENSSAADSSAEKGEKDEADKDEKSEKDDEKKGFITGKLIVDKNITPLEFFHKYCSVDLNDYVDVADAPHKEYGKLYELRRCSNMVAGHEIQFANMGMDVIKKALIAQLKAGHPAWFACDCEPFSLRRMGVFDRKSVNVEALFDVEYKLDKADRLRFGESLGNHAMTIQGVDLDENGKPTRWKIENSWGKMVGENGYFVMSDEWFSDFVYDVVLRREFLDADTLAVAHSKPVELEPWDPFCKATRCIA